jgi:hypothetical protein
MRDSNGKSRNKPAKLGSERGGSLYSNKERIPGNEEPILWISFASYRMNPNDFS